MDQVKSLYSVWGFFVQTSYQKPVAMSFFYPQSCCFSKAFDQLMGAESFQERCAPCWHSCPMPPKLTRARMNFALWRRPSLTAYSNTTSKSESCRWVENNSRKWGYFFVCNNAKFPSGEQAPESTVVPSVPAEEDEHAAGIRWCRIWKDSLPRHQWGHRERDLPPRVQQELLWKEWYFCPPCYQLRWLCSVLILSPLSFYLWTGGLFRYQTHALTHGPVFTPKCRWTQVCFRLKGSNGGIHQRLPFDEDSPT